MKLPQFEQKTSFAPFALPQREQIFVCLAAEAAAGVLAGVGSSSSREEGGTEETPPLAGELEEGGFAEKEGGSRRGGTGCTGFGLAGAEAGAAPMCLPSQAL